jgi:outer membrane protein assembly factor BamB
VVPWVLGVVLGAAGPGLALDAWPQFRGPQRDGRSGERNLADQWPEAGPRLLWRRALDQGFSAVSVADGALYTLAAQGVSRDGVAEEDAHEYVVALRATDGEELWRTRLDRAFADARGSGSRSSPTLWGERLFVLTAHGTLAALDRDGRVVWRHDLLAEHGGELPLWGFAASPLVVTEGGRDLVVVGAGGPERGVVAYDATSGALAWSAAPGPVGYSSPVEAHLGGHRQVVHLLGDRAVGLSPSGELLWSYPWPVINNINVATPVILPDDRVFLSTSYDVGSVVLEIGPGADEGQRPANGAGSLVAREIWSGRVMRNHFQTSVLWRGHLFGFDNANLKCVEAATGEERWRFRGLGKGSLILADDKLFVLGERGRLVLARPSTEGFSEVSSVQVVRDRTWTAPTLAEGRLYIRTEAELLAYDVDGEKGGD